MELAIPLLALGGMYVISNQKQSATKNAKENFNNMGVIGNNIESRYNNYLPNTNTPIQNYPVVNNDELLDNIQEYPNPNTATDKYFNQNAYEQKNRSGAQMDNNIQQIYSLSGDYMETSDFRHNNMVPFDGGKPKGQSYNENNNEVILDNYVGNGSQVNKKIEQAPLFKPQDNVQWTHGAPGMSDFFQSRQTPATKNNMVKPFESVMVGPGLNKGFESSGSAGFNSGMEARDKWLPKTVNELRVSTNPKEEYSLENLEGPAASVIKNVGVLGKVEKYRPDTFFINTQDRWLTTTGAEKAGRYVSQEVLKISNRNEITTYQTGTPNATLKTASYVPKKYEEPKKIQLEGFDVGHSHAGKSTPHDSDHFNLKSHTNYTNNRVINTQPDTFGSGFASAIGAVIAPIMDILKPSKKEEFSSNMRIYGNLGGEIPGNYIVNSGDIPITTIKETTLYRPNGFIGNQSNDAYAITDHQPITNQRDSTTEFSQMNGMSSNYGSRQYDATYRQTNNETKEKTIVGRTNAGNASIFNSHKNITMSKLDADRDNNRLWAPQAVIQHGPSVQTYGKSSVPQQVVENNSNRIDADMLNAFKSNPYTHSLHSAV